MLGAKRPTELLNIHQLFTTWHCCHLSSMLLCTEQSFQRKPHKHASNTKSSSQHPLGSNVILLPISTTRPQLSLQLLSQGVSQILYLAVNVHCYLQSYLSVIQEVLHVCNSQSCSRCRNLQGSISRCRNLQGMLSCDWSFCNVSTGSHVHVSCFNQAIISNNQTVHNPQLPMYSWSIIMSYANFALSNRLAIATSVLVEFLNVVSYFS